MNLYFFLHSHHNCNSSFITITRSVYFSKSFLASKKKEINDLWNLSKILKKTFQKQIHIMKTFFSCQFLRLSTFLGCQRYWYDSVKDKGQGDCTRYWSSSSLKKSRGGSQEHCPPSTPDYNTK